MSALLLVAMLMTTPQDRTINWTLVAPGVWKGAIGKGDEPTLLSASGAKSQSAGLVALGSAAAKISPFKDATGAVESDFATARIPLTHGEKLFGLGLQMQGANRRGGIYHLRVDHYASGTERLHAPVPLFVSSKGYAVLFDTSRPCSVYMDVGNRRDGENPPPRDRNTDSKWDAQPSSNAVEASVQGPGLAVYVFEGPSPMEAIQRYNLFCGGGALPPRWALGFWHRTPSLATEDAVEAEVAEFHRRGFPIDVLGLEPGWQSKSYPCTFAWDKERFPNPQKLTADLNKWGVHVNLWTNPYVSPDSPIYKALEPDYASHTVWLGAVPDLLKHEADKVIEQYFTKAHLDVGVSGYKIDEIDGFDNWLWPDHAAFPSGISGLRMRQIYGLLWQKELDSMFRKKGKRTFGLIRGSNGGASRFPFAIYSDTYDHRQYITGMVSTGFAGVLWCAEAREAANGEEWVRRMQTAAVSHIAQLNAWSSGTKPWSFPGYEDAVKSAMLFRTRLTPYLYTAFAQYHFHGTPVIRPMALVDGGEEMDQYLLGDELLVAPMLAGQTKRTVRLPKGAWYDYETGQKVGDGVTIEISPALAKIPIFVREGALIPTLSGEATNSTQTPSSKLVVRQYGTGIARGLLYSDDGESFGYESGDYAWFHLASKGDEVLIEMTKGRRKLGYASVQLLRVSVSK